MEKLNFGEGKVLDFNELKKEKNGDLPGRKKGSKGEVIDLDRYKNTKELEKQKEHGSQFKKMIMERQSSLPEQFIEWELVYSMCENPEEEQECLKGMLNTAKESGDWALLYLLASGEYHSDYAKSDVEHAKNEIIAQEAWANLEKAEDHVVGWRNIRDNHKGKVKDLASRKVEELGGDKAADEMEKKARMNHEKSRLMSLFKEAKSPGQWLHVYLLATGHNRYGQDTFKNNIIAGESLKKLQDLRGEIGEWESISSDRLVPHMIRQLASEKIRKLKQSS